MSLIPYFRVMIKAIIPAALLCLAATAAQADDVYASRRAEWLRIAQESTPALHHETVSPVAVVEAVKDAKAFQGWRYEAKTGEKPQSLYSKNFKDVGAVTLDFGNHYVGRFSFSVKTLSRTLDAPLRLKFTFGELPAEINTPLDPWKGSLGRAWMQDEIVTLMRLDTMVTLPRRMAFRYVRIELLGASAGYDFAIDSVSLDATTSAGPLKTQLRPSCPERVRRINDVGVRTLRECMQTVYEDGPKRDQRLWIGDMYLESLANRYSFRQFGLTRHCLYAFAALAEDNGRLVANLFEHPQLHPQYGSYCLTYSLLFNSTLLEYLSDTGDTATARDLWPVARRQMEDALSYVGDDGVFNRDRHGKFVWLFFDWRAGLDENAPMQAATVFALQQTYELARKLGREKEVSLWPAMAKKMSRAAIRKYYDKRRGVFVSGKAGQVSVVSQVWMTKAGIVSGEKARRALLASLSDSTAVCPGTPYATHYLIEAMLKAGMKEQARKYLVDYWGDMVDKGADTYWEAYDPKDEFISPYNFSPLNSACHAWSCTPIYFIHKYPEVFQ